MSSYSFDTKSGKLIPPSEEELKELDQTSAIVAYTTGQMPDGRVYYAFIAVLPSKYIEFHAKTKACTPLVLDEYGTILQADFEARPSAEVIEYMRTEYGFDENFETTLSKKLEEERTVFFKAQQETRIQDALQMLIKKRDSSE